MSDFIPKISPEYFKKLLGSSQSITAVEELSRFWSYRAKATEPFFGLSETEYLCELCLIYLGHVTNGGHLQYFETRGTALIEDTGRAITEVLNQDYLKVFKEAAATVKRFEHCNWIDPANISDEDAQTWVQCDQLFYQFKDTDDLMLRYLQSQSENILLVERHVS